MAKDVDGSMISLEAHRIPHIYFTLPQTPSQPKVLSLADVVKNERRYSFDQEVDIQGMLTGYRIAPGFFTRQVTVTMDYNHTFGFQLHTWTSGPDMMQANFDAFLGKTIGARIRVPAYRAKAITFGHSAYELRHQDF
ncbi:MAG TPA: hypothetical protein VK158_03330 [Acidobacteriota bacterium]|nr:hypothetical protein [Acidobacteriota bacterium]